MIACMHMHAHMNAELIKIFGGGWLQLALFINGHIFSYRLSLTPPLSNELCVPDCMMEEQRHKVVAAFSVFCNKPVTKLNNSLLTYSIWIKKQRIYVYVQILAKICDINEEINWITSDCQ